MLRCCITSCLAALTVYVSAAFAQDRDDINKDYVVIERVEPPRAPSLEAYQNVARQNGVQSEVDYVSKVDWQATPENTPTVRPRRDGTPVNLDGFGVLLAVIVVGGALLLWLKFGGSGVLLSREPSEGKPKANAPANWNIGAADMSGSTQGLLDRIASMPDRSAALVLLLRHCLLAAAEATDTRFARSDTERLAFRRLPSQWPLMGGLKTILHRTELAHYGARPVTEDVFSNALAAGRDILDAGKVRTSRHG
jgi:hypothetical protein